MAGVRSVSQNEPQSVSDNERIWTLKELEILHELQKPTVVIVSSVYESPHSVGGLRSRHKVVFENLACVKHFGTPRSQQDHDMHLTTFPEGFQKKRRQWLSGVASSKKTTQVRMDLRILMSPLFYGISEKSPVCMAQLESKPIRLETSPGRVELAILHMAEVDKSSYTDTRLAAMLDRSPIHALLFSRSGKILATNKAVIRKIQECAGAPFAADAPKNAFKTLFNYGDYPGGKEEAEMHYEEAMTAVFSLQLKRHYHVQPYRSSKDGKQKWANMEMWPMPDPIDGSPAVLVQKWNITAEKQIELQLEASQVALQRYNQELEEDSAAMQQERLQLQQQAESLAERLEAVLSNKFMSRTAFDADTPIDKTLALLQELIKGNVPSTQKAMDLYQILNESDTNLRQPVGLEKQLLKHMTLDSEVGQSMLQLLQERAIGTPSILGNDISRSKQPPEGPAQSLQLLRTAHPVLVPAAVTPIVDRLLQDACNNWQFDMFSLAEQTPGTTLSLLTFHLFKQTGLHMTWDQEAKLCQFLQRIELGYNPSNPYHNSIHVASVVQMTNMLLCHGGILKSGAMSQQQHWASIWSALVHDFEHGGLNNDFLIKTHHPLAITYNDQSPLENHHMAAATRAFQETIPVQASRILFDNHNAPSLDLQARSRVDDEGRLAARSQAVHQVLGTDMKKHFDITSRFQAAFKQPAADGPGAGPTAMDWDSVKPEDKILVHQMVLKCADIGHLAATPRAHKHWAFQLEEEFFCQGDKERACGLPVSPLMDRSTQGGMTRSQMGFFSIVGIPMFKAMAELFEESQPMLEGVLANYHHWEAATPDAELPS